MAIDRSTWFVYVSFKDNWSAKISSAFLDGLTKDYLHPIRVVLTYNGKEFKDQFSRGCNQPSGNNLFYHWRRE